MTISHNEVSAAAHRALALFSGKLDARLITSGNGEPYMWRGYLSGDGDNEVASAFLHKFVASDAPGELHCHPWEWSVSFILFGEYEELRADGRDVPNEVGDGGTSELWDPDRPMKILDNPFDQICRPGMRNVINGNTFHRVNIRSPEVWTLFVHGPRVQPWGFVEEGTYGRPVSMRVVRGKTSDRAIKGNMATGQIYP